MDLFLLNWGFFGDRDSFEWKQFQIAESTEDRLNKCPFKFKDKMFNINFSLTFVYILSVVALLATPGPVTLLVVRAGLSGGFKNSLKTIIGTNTASLILIVVSAFIVNGIFIVDARIFPFVKAAGCLYISWMARTMIQEALMQKNVHDPKKDDASSNNSGFWGGFVMAISNPKDIIFFGSFFPQFFGVMPTPHQSFVFLILLWILLDYSILSALAFFFNRIVTPAYEKRFLLFASVLLLLIGVVGFVYAGYELLQML